MGGRHHHHRRLRRPYPVTVLGRFVAVGLMVGGVAVIGVVTASVASWLVEQVRTTTAKEVQAADTGLEAKIDQLAELLRRQEKRREQEEPRTVDTGQR